MPERASNEPSPRLATQLLELSRHSAASQLSVKKLCRVIEQDRASLNIDGLIEQLIATDHYDGAQALAIAAGLSGLDFDARCLVRILPLADSIEGLPLLIHLSRGDRETVLLDTVESATMAWERDALVLLVLAYSCQDNPPKRLLAAMRTLARHHLGPEASALLGSATKLIDDPEVNKVAHRHLMMASIFGEDALKGQQRLLWQPNINDLPERDPATVIVGRTLVREGDKVGRNEPCPCGSGKKYKKCCLGKALSAPCPTNFASSEGRVDQSALGWKMTPDQFFEMRIQELCRQDLSALPSELLAIAVSRFCQYHHWDYARQAINELSGRDDLPRYQTMDGYRRILIGEALRAHQLDCAREQIALLDKPDELDDSLRLEIKLHDPNQNTLRELNDYALAQLREQGDASGVELAYGLLATFPALGIFFARGALSSKRVLDSEMLLENIEEVRDALQLPAGDAGQELFDRISEQGMDEHLLRHAEQAASQTQKVAVRETETVREQYRASRQRIDDLQATLLDKESHLKELLNRLNQSPSEETSPSADRHSDSPNPDVLRDKIAELKALLNLSNKERSTLRRQLLEATNRMEKISDTDIETIVEEEEPLESADLADSKRATAVRRFPVFRDSAKKSLRKIPLQVANAAMQAVADLTSAKAAGWSSVKRLKGASGIFSQRIGIHYRLLFSLDPAGDELIVQELIHRRDLEMAVKRYAGSSASSR